MLLHEIDRVPLAAATLLRAAVGFAQQAPGGPPGRALDALARNCYWPYHLKLSIGILSDKILLKNNMLTAVTGELL